MILIILVKWDSMIQIVILSTILESKFQHNFEQSLICLHFGS